MFYATPGVLYCKPFGVLNYSKCPLNADIICKLALEKQEILPLSCMD